MPADVLDRLGRLALPLLGRVAGPMVLVKVPPPQPLNGGVPAGAPVDYAVQGWVDQEETQSRVYQGRPGVNLVLHLVAASCPVPPATGDTVRYNGKDWHVMSATGDALGLTWTLQVWQQ